MTKTGTYSVKQVADLSGVTVRTLHHYDHIGVLKPSFRSQKRYRLYVYEDLIRLQQILLYRELDVSLDKIQRILDDPEFDLIEALQGHRQHLVQKRQRMQVLIRTLDDTLGSLTGDHHMPLKDSDMYAGFDQQKIDRWNREVEEKYDPQKVAESRRNVGKMSKAQFQAIQKQGARVTAALAEKMDLDPASSEVQGLIAEHHAWIENFYLCPPDLYKGLGQMYVENPEFTAYYDNFKPGLAQFMCQAMHYFAGQLENRGNR